ncbi:MAG: pyrroline-5-carboxylate reductase dimerization domain-containing protein, partial [Henriciella sp.]
SLEALRNSVTSKNGATQAGLEVLRGDSTLENLLRDTIQATYNRTTELR